jgi:acyl-CoA reductase-like NAD-dependent aldehyde dehydrogenase
VLDSTTEQLMGRIPEGTAEDVERAVSAARSAFESWSQTSVEERADARTRGVPGGQGDPDGTSL